MSEIEDTDISTDNILSQYANEGQRIQALLTFYRDELEDLSQQYTNLSLGLKVEEATGTDLDSIGTLVGVGRPTFFGGVLTYFQWNSDEFPDPEGGPWNIGVWTYPGYQPTGGIPLDDPRYRLLIKSKIINNFNHLTRDVYQEIMNIVIGQFPEITEGDAEVTLLFAGMLSYYEKAFVINQPLPMGVRILQALDDDGPFFSNGPPAGPPPEGQALGVYPSSGSEPRGLAYRASDNVLFEADNGTDLIYLRDATTGGLLSSYPAMGSDVRGLTYRSSGNVLFQSSTSDDTIYLVNADTGALLSSYPSSGPGPRGLAFRASGNILFEMDAQAPGTIYQRDASTGVAITNYQASTGTHTGLTYRALDDVIMESASGEDKVYVRDATTGAAIRSFLVESGSVYGLALITDNNLKIADPANDRIYSVYVD